MPEARDRLSREDDILTTYSRRRNSNARSRTSGRGDSLIFVLQDGADDGQRAETPFRWRGTAMTGTVAEASGGGGSGRGRGVLGSPRIGRGGYFLRSPASIFGRENLSPMIGRGRGRPGYRGRGSGALPAWYPRKPLRDITAVVRAMERRRARREEGEGLLLTESPILQNQTVHDLSVSTSGAHLEHDLSMMSPHPTFGIRHSPPTVGKVPKILLDITRQRDEETACLTPQRKLLNNIDKVEKVVMDELGKLKRTPTAKKIEREKRVRTLMSMR